MFNFLKRDKYNYYPPVHPLIDLLNRLPRRKLNEQIVCNVGAGSGLSALGRQLPLIPFERLDFIDIHQPYLDGAQAQTYAAKYVNFFLADARQFDFSPYSIVLMFDVLEHLPKEDSLAIMDRIKSKQVIFIPLEKEFRKNVYEAESQDHLSLWTEEDFKSRGYRTQVLENFHKEDNRIFPALWALKN